MRRTFHNTTAKYNVYFNGNEAYKRGMLAIKDAHKENFNEVLPMFLFSEENNSSAKGDMDYAIEKAMKLVNDHSITVKPKSKGGDLSQKQKEFYAKKEYCKWVDDAYLLMGKAHFVNREFYSARKSFEYIITEYKNEPIRFDATLWLAQSKGEADSYEDAQIILDKLKDEGKMPEKYNGRFYAIQTDILLKQHKYEDAIPPLIETIKYTKSRKLRKRYTYILAQLYQNVGNGRKAIENYNLVLKMNPPYAMAFNAKINIATAFDSNSGNSDEIVKELKKLLKDDKNKEFRDQIYFALANIEYEKGNIDQAIEYYELSIQTSESNEYQKSMSYLAIGDIYYNRKDFIKAQPYIDSCVQWLSEDNRRYMELYSKSKALNDLAYNHKMVIEQDSLLMIAGMGERERSKFISNIISDLKEEEIRKKEEAKKRREQMLYDSQVGFESQNKGNTWYFYNTKKVEQGKLEFENKWGERKLEDNWRRKNKSASGWDEEEEEILVENEAGEEKKQLSKMSPEYYEQDIPETDSAKALAHSKIKEGLISKGFIFSYRLVDYKQAIEAFEDLERRYPDDEELMPMVYYNLTALHKLNDNQAESDRYKAMLLEKYNDTKYAQAIANPNFLNEIRSRELRVEKMYKQAYRQYLLKDYHGVVQTCEESKTAFLENHLEAKFKMLEALSVGRIAGIDTMKSSLENVVETYEKDSVSLLAKSILKEIIDKDMKELPKDTLPPSAMSNESSAASSVFDEEIIEEEIYSYNDDTHLYVIAVKTEYVDINRVKFNMINYNLEYFSNFDFKLGIRKISETTSLLILRSLSDAQQAMNYYSLVNISDEVFEEIDKDNVDHFIITESNLTKLAADKRVSKYLEFFYENYMK